jgi:hypothetical protein
MIATVHIAPIERWCPLAVADVANILPFFKPGQAVQVDTASVWVVEDDRGTFRNWRLAGESLQRLHAMTEFRCNSMCEHMLEMD